MARRIFRSIVSVAVLAVLLTALLLVPALYNVHEESMSAALLQEAQAIASALPLAEDKTAYLQNLSTHSRITLIAPDGSVLFDSTADENRMENHAQRPEIQQALETGIGESLRPSDTLAETSLYCACRVEDGSVLRLGSTRRSMLGTLIGTLPLLIAMLLGVALVSLLLARYAARRIVTPINALDLNAPLSNETYDELAPLLTRMHSQHEQLNRQMKSLESARAELAALMTHMREGMMLIDPRETVLSINQSAARIFETDAAQAVGQPLLSVSRDADLHDLLRRTLGGEGGRLEMSRHDRRYALYLSPVQQEDKVRGAVLLILDITERFAAEASRREFTANVSHELKTPLTSISGFAEIIRDGIAQPGDVSHFAGMICREASRMISLVNDILELSRLDEKQIPGPRETVPLLPLLEEVQEELSLPARQRGLNLTVSGDEASIVGYPSLLREMFFNLMDNAVKYTPEGGAIRVTVQNCNNAVICAVSDNGIGIPPEHQPHVFERFYRVDKSHSRQTGGTGLGLAIVKHGAQLHQARLNLVSEEGQGTTVTLTFPQLP